MAPKTIDRTFNPAINKNDLMSFQKNAKTIILNPNEFSIYGQRYKTYAEILAYFAALPGIEQPSITNPFIIKINGIISEDIALIPYVHLVGENYFSSKLTGRLTSNSPISTDYFQYSVSNLDIKNLDMTVNPMELLVLVDCFIRHAKTDGALGIICMDCFIQGGQFTNVGQIEYFLNCTFFPTGAGITDVERISGVSSIYFSDPIDNVSVGDYMYFSVDLDSTFDGIYEVTAINYISQKLTYSQVGQPDVGALTTSGAMMSALSLSTVSGDVIFDSCESLGGGGPVLEYTDLTETLQFTNCTLSFFNILQSTNNHTVIFQNSDIICSKTVTLLLDTGIRHFVFNSSIGVTTPSTTNISWTIFGGNLYTINLLSFNNIVDMSGGWANKGGRFDNSTVSLPGSPDCFQTAIEALASMVGSQNVVLIDSQTIALGTNSGYGLDYNITKNEWTAPNDICQIRGVYVASMNGLSDCIVFKGLIPASAGLGLSTGNYYFNTSDGKLTTTESNVYAGECLPNGDFLVNISVEKGRIGLLTRDAEPAYTTAYETIYGDATGSTFNKTYTADTTSSLLTPSILAVSRTKTEFPGYRGTIISDFDLSDVSTNNRWVVKNSLGATLDFVVSACKWDIKQDVLWVCGATGETGTNEGFVGVFDPVAETITYVLFSDSTLFYSPTALDINPKSAPSASIAFVCGLVASDSFIINFTYDGSTLQVQSGTQLVVYKTESLGVPLGTKLKFNDICYDKYNDFLALAGFYEISSGQGRPMFMTIGPTLYSGLQIYVLQTSDGGEATGVTVEDSGSAGIHNFFILGTTGATNDVFIQHFLTDGGTTSFGNSETCSQFNTPTTGKIKWVTGGILYGSITDFLGGSYVASYMTRTSVSGFTIGSNSTYYSQVYGDSFDVYLDLMCIDTTGTKIVYAGNTNRGGFASNQAIILDNINMLDDASEDDDGLVKISVAIYDKFINGATYANEPGFYVSISGIVISEIAGTYSIDYPSSVIDIDPSVIFQTPAIEARIFDAGTYWVSKNENPTNNNDIDDTSGLGYFFRKGYIWLNYLTAQMFMCTEDTIGQAKWLCITPKNSLSITDYCVNSLNKEWRLKTNTDVINNVVEFNKAAGVDGFAYSALRLGAYSGQRIEFDWDEATVIDTTKQTYMRLDVAAYQNSAFSAMTDSTFEFGLVSSSGISSGPYILIRTDSSIYGDDLLHLVVSDGVNPETDISLGVGLDTYLTPPYIELSIIGSLVYVFINGVHMVTAAAVPSDPLQPWLAWENRTVGTLTYYCEVKRITIENER